MNLTATIKSKVASLGRMADRDTPLLRDQWYIAAHIDEVGRTMLARDILGDSVLLVRREDGMAVALQNRCPHRGFPLVQGRLEGNAVVCGYHGFTFGTDGTCLRVPSQDHVPAGLRLAAYPLVERAPFLWIWMGDASRADTAAIPDHAWLTAPGHAHIEGYFLVKSSYIALHENVLDLTHLHYLHGSAVGSAGFSDAPIEITEHDGMIRILRVERGGEAPSHYARMAGLTSGDVVDRISDAYWVSPAMSYAKATIVDRQPAPDRRAEFNFWVMHAFTPANRNDTHYFWANGRDCSVNDPETDAWLRGRSAKVLSEDVTAMEAIQDLWARTERERYDEFSVAADRPGVQLRRRIARLAAEELERSSSAAAATPE